MFNGDSRRVLDVYVSLNERIRAEYGKGSIETAERLLELVGLDENELSEYWQMFETVMKDNEKCRVARGETRQQFRPITIETKYCYELL